MDKQNVTKLIRVNTAVTKRKWILWLLIPVLQLLCGAAVLAMTQIPAQPGADFVVKCFVCLIVTGGAYAGFRFLNYWVEESYTELREGEKELGINRYDHYL